MIAWLQSHSVPLILLLALVASYYAIPLAKAKVLALKAYRDHQDSVAAKAALNVVTAVVATAVARAERVVRDLKNPGKPGSWNPAIQGPAILRDVVSDAWKLGGSAWAKLRKLQKLDVVTGTKLLETIAEEQLLFLRDEPPPAALSPAEMAALVAEILRDPTAARTTLPGPAPAPSDESVDEAESPAARVLVNGEGISAVVQVEGDPARTAELAAKTVRALGELGKYLPR